MKKLILTIAFIGTALVANAQVGIGNTDPKATLDVTGVATATVPDGVIVPRFNRLELTAKSGAYSAANQLGALVFVTDAAGLTDAKTASVTAVGFYYYAANNTWVGVGGSAAVAQRYEGIRGTVTPVNAATYTVDANDYVVITRFNNGVDITLPALANNAADIGRTVKIINNNTSGALTFQSTAPLVGNFIVNINRGIEVIWTGISWASPQK